MRRVFFIAFIIGTGIVRPQSTIREFVKENTIKIKSIDPNYNSDSDLEVIGDAIGNSTIVMLGEQDHGDAPAFLAKTRLIKYLHEKKGFNVLAFESDFFALNEGWENTNKKNTDLDSFLRHNIYALWSKCDECNELFYNYIPATQSTNHPLIISGFDNQLCLDYSVKHLKIQLGDLIQSFNLSLQPVYKDSIIPLLDSLMAWRGKTDPPAFDKINQYLVKIKEELSEKIDVSDFRVMIITNLIAFNQQFKFMYSPLQAYNIRDAQMAENIKWLKNIKYPNEKIIIWAHNYHIFKFESTKQLGAWGSTSMCGYMSRDTNLIEQTFVLGFTSYSGSGGRIGSEPYVIEKPWKECIENVIPPEIEYAFIDFHKYSRSSQKFWMKGINHFPIKEKWIERYDGMFYIRDMYPCKRLGK